MTSQALTQAMTVILSPQDRLSLTKLARYFKPHSLTQVGLFTSVGERWTLDYKVTGQLGGGGGGGGGGAVLCP